MSLVLPVVTTVLFYSTGLKQLQKYFSELLRKLFNSIAIFENRMNLYSLIIESALKSFFIDIQTCFFCLDNPNRISVSKSFA